MAQEDSCILSEAATERHHASYLLRMRHPWPRKVTSLDYSLSTPIN